MGQPVISQQPSVVSQKPAPIGLDGSLLLKTEDWRLETLAPGRVLGLEGRAGLGLTSVGLRFIAEATKAEPVAVLDSRGWFCPSAAWTAGIAPERLVVVRCGDRSLWPQVVATLVEGFSAVYAEVPPHVPERSLRRLGAIARSRGCRLVLRALNGGLPTGMLHLRLEGIEVGWRGADRGHGRLLGRVLTLRASGKGSGGIERYLEMEEEDGAHTVRLVPGLAVAPSGRAAG